MFRQPKRKSVRYWSEADQAERDGTAVERNGNLTWIEDQETGRGDWYAPHEYRTGE